MPKMPTGRDIRKSKTSSKPTLSSIANEVALIDFLLQHGFQLEELDPRKVDLISLFYSLWP